MKKNYGQTPSRLHLNAQQSSLFTRHHTRSVWPLSARKLRVGAICLEDGRRGGAAHAAGRVERVDAEELVGEAARDAKHGRAAVLALGVELEGLRLGVVVAHPRGATDVTGLAVADVRVALVVEEEVARLHHARREHDLQ